MRRARQAVVTALVAILAPTAALSGGARAVNGVSAPMKWSTAGPIAYNPERGMLGLLTNGQARHVFAEALAEWQATGLVTFVEGTVLPGDVDGAGFPVSNASHWANFWRRPGDSWSPLIFDADGAVVDGLFGVGARFDVLGVGGIDTAISASPTITEGSIVINGLFYDGVGLPDSPEDLPSLVALRAVMVHEIGHFLNLDHSVVNYELADDGDPDNDVFLPSMLPVVTDDEGALASLNPDDVAALRGIYDPAPATGLGGVVLAAEIPFQGAHVVVRDPSNPLLRAYGTISGALYFPCNAGSMCDPCATTCQPGNPLAQGAWSIRHLDPGAYTVEVEQIDRGLSLLGGAFIGPLATPPTLPGPEEFRDGAESGTAWDDPDDTTTVVAGTMTGVDIHFDALPVADSFEPNNSLAAASALADLPSGSDTAAAVLGVGDLDVYAIPVVAGQRIRIDIDAREFGSAVDPIVGLYDGSNQLVVLADDGVDPDSRTFTFDPSIDRVVSFTGTAKLVVSAYPDVDLDGSGGSTAGPYWIRVRVESDSDADGVFDPRDRCPNDPADDVDDDGLCAGADNCPTAFNPGQETGGDADAIPDACDNCPTIANLGQQDDDGDGIGNACEACAGDPENDPDGDGVCSAVDTCPTISNLSQAAASPAVLLDSSLSGRFALTPDATTVVYLGTGGSAGSELWRVPLAGGTPVRLSATLVTGGNVQSFAIAPDGSRVVYLADQETDEKVELYSVPLAGGAVTKLNRPLVVAGGDVRDFVIAPNSARVVYRADGDTDERFPLFSAPIGGGFADQISGTMTGGGNVCAGACSSSVTPYVFAGPSRVLYVADQFTDEVFELFSVPVTAFGGPSFRLNGTLVTNGDVLFSPATIQITPDNARVLYPADQETDGVNELYSVPVLGGTSVKLNGATDGAGVLSFFLGTGPTQVFFVASQAGYLGRGLYRVPIGGGTPTPVSAPGAQVGEARLTSDGIRAVYVDVSYAPAVLVSVPWAGGTPLGLSDARGVASSTGLAGFSADGTKIAYRAPSSLVGRFDLLWVSVTGGAVTRLNEQSAFSFSDVVGVGDGFVYRSLTSLGHLYFSAAAGYPIVQLDESNVNEFLVTPDSSRAVFGVSILYSAPVVLGERDGDGILDGCDVCPGTADASQSDADGDGIGDACDSCPDLASVGSLDSDGDGVGDICDNCASVPNTLQTDADGDGLGDECDRCGRNAGSRFECPGTLYGDPDNVDPEACPRLHTAGPAGVAVASSSRRIVYMTGNNSGELRSDSVVQEDSILLAQLNNDHNAFSTPLLGREDRVVFVGEARTPGRQELFSVPLLGGTIRRLSGPTALDGEPFLAPGAVQLDPQGDIAVYLAGLEGNGFAELYSVPIAGGFARKLNGPLVSGGTVERFAISADGSTVVYLARQESAAVTELYQVPIAGGVVTKLSAPLVAGGDVTDFSIADTNARVVYVASQQVAGRPELYSVPITGGAATKLNGNVTIGASLVAIVPGGGRVIFLSDQVSPGREDLRSVPITGGPSAPLNPPLAGALGPVAVTASRVVYQAEKDTAGVMELYSVPVTGGASTKLNATLDPGEELCNGGVNCSAFQLTPDGSRVVFLAGPQASQPLEMFSVPVSGGAASSIGVPGAGVQYFSLAPDNRGVVYSQGNSSLSYVDMDGAVRLRIDDGESFEPLLVGVDGGFVVYDGGGGEIFSALLPTDSDLDDVPELCDVCAGASDPAQSDADSDGVGDGCDNCPAVPNRNQADADDNGTGDACTPDLVRPVVVEIRPATGASDVAVSTEIIVELSEPIDPAAVNGDGLVVRAGNVKVEGRVILAPGDRSLVFDPHAPLAAGTYYTVELTSVARDLAGNLAVPFTSTFDTVASGAAQGIDVSSVGTPAPTGISGRGIAGQNADDRSGTSNASLGDVNDDGIGDLLIGVPNFDVGGSTDAGKGRLILGSTTLQSNAAAIASIDFNGAVAMERAGTSVSRAGDIGGPSGIPDGIADFLVGVPAANGEAGRVYLVFGNAGLTAAASYSLSTLTSCNPAVYCGVEFTGEVAGDRAGESISFGGDVNDDGIADLLIGAPGADPNGANSGKAYLIFGPLGPGTIALSGVGTSSPGTIFNGEGAGDRAGASVSNWQDSNGIDDLIIGAPGATVLADDGTPMAEAGLVYAIHGGLGNVPTPVAELSYVANYVSGVVFLGHSPGGRIGRSVTGAVDVDHDGVADILFGANNEAYLIAGDDPKSISATPKTGGPVADIALQMPDGTTVYHRFDAVRFLPGAEGSLGELQVGPAGDLDADGFDDFEIGAPLADPLGRVDAGKAYIVFGRPFATLDGEVALSEIGGTRPGATFVGSLAGDQLGASLDGGFDLTGDGVDEAVIGAPFADVGSPTLHEAGMTYLISLFSPEEVQSLRLSRSGPSTKLEWTVTGRALAYNVYRGDLARVRAAGGVHTATMCAATGSCHLLCGTVSDVDSNGLPDTLDADSPVVGQVFVYLVTGESRIGEGPLASASAPRARVNDGRCP